MERSRSRARHTVAFMGSRIESGVSGGPSKPSSCGFDPATPSYRSPHGQGGRLWPVALRVGIDVGGTFTDLFLHDSESGRFWIGEDAVDAAGSVDRRPRGRPPDLRDGRRSRPRGIEQILHGTTVATNAVLESKGSRVGLVITEGWSQLLHLAESWTPGPLFGFFTYVKPEPLVDYEDIREAPERMDAQGRGAEGARRGRRARRRARAARRRRRGAHRLPAQLLREPRARAAREGARDRGARRHRGPRLDLLRDHPRVPRVRARHDDGDELVRRPDPAALPRQPRGAAARRRRRGARAGRPLRRRPPVGAGRAASIPCRPCSPARPAASTAPPSSPGPRASTGS